MLKNFPNNWISLSEDMFENVSYLIICLISLVLCLCYLPFYFVYYIGYGYWKDQKQQKKLQEQMEKEHPDLCFFMNHIEEFIKYFDEICKIKEIYMFEFSKKCEIRLMQFRVGGTVKHTLGRLLKEYLKKNGWRFKDFFVVSGSINVLSGGAVGFGWDFKLKKWCQRTINKCSILTQDEMIFENDFKCSEELLKLFEQVKSLKNEVISF